MGNYRFRLSDMMPHAWFYKLKDMSRTRNRNPSHSIKKKQPTTAPPPQQQQQQQTQPKQSHFSHPRNSYYFSTESRVGDSFYNSPSNPKFSDTHFPDPPRKSSKRSRAKRRTIKSSSKLVTSSVSAGCSCRATIDSVWTTKPDSTPDYSPSLETSPEHDVPEFAVATTDPFGGLGSWSNSCSCRVSSSATDIIIDMDEKSLSSKFEKVHGFDSISELDLPPILTKPVKFYDMINDMEKNKKENNDEPTKFRRNLAKLEEKIADETSNEPTKFRRNLAKLEEKIAHESLCVKVIKEESIKTVKEQKTSPAIRRSSSAASPGMKLRANSPRIASRKIQAYNRKSISSSTTTNSTRSRRKNISESFAIVKSSFNPQKDFKDSMVEMIVENNIRASKDLEDLLACYLSLNSNEYHDLIVKVFEQIWYDMTDIHL